MVVPFMGFVDGWGGCPRREPGRGAPNSARGASNRRRIDAWVRRPWREPAEGARVGGRWGRSTAHRPLAPPVRTDHDDRVPAAGAVGDRRRPVLGLHRTAPVRGPNGQRVAPGRGGPLVDPLPPGVPARHVAEAGRLPGPVVDPHLDPVDAPVHAPRPPRRPRPRPAGTLARPRGVSIRANVLIGACWAQPRRTQ